MQCLGAIEDLLFCLSLCLDHLSRLSSVVLVFYSGPIMHKLFPCRVTESAELPVAHLTLLTRWESYCCPGFNTSARFLHKTKRRLLEEREEQARGRPVKVNALIMEKVVKNSVRNSQRSAFTHCRSVYVCVCASNDTDGAWAKAGMGG